MDGERRETQTDSLFHLSEREREVVDLLRTVDSKQFRLEDWYVGAIRVLGDSDNPDRYAQSAQSLRELIEKLPRAIPVNALEGHKSNAKERRNRLSEILNRVREAYDDALLGKTVNQDLSELISMLGKYLDEYQLPSKRVQLYNALVQSDPLHYAMDSQIQQQKARDLGILRTRLEGYAHHSQCVEHESFLDVVSVVEQLIIDAFAPTTARDQLELRKLVNLDFPTQEELQRLRNLIQRHGSNCVFFFQEARKPEWLPLVREWGLLENPPSVRDLGDDRVEIPFWPPMSYLKKIAADYPEEVVAAVLAVPKTENPRILRDMVEIAIAVPDVGLSLRLQAIVNSYVRSRYRWITPELLSAIVRKWCADRESGVEAALRIVQYVIAFQQDPNRNAKSHERKQSKHGYLTTLEPTSRFSDWEYREIIDSVVKPFSLIAPLVVAKSLFEAASAMVELCLYDDERVGLGDYDMSDLWARRVDKAETGYQEQRALLVEALTHACEQVYSLEPDKMTEIDNMLRESPWFLFKRIRQHLYAQFPNATTLPWIKEEISKYNRYAKDRYGYELQRMIRLSISSADLDVITSEDVSLIYGEITSGPDKGEVRCWMADDFTEERYLQYEHSFHLSQLTPFKARLNREQLSYYQLLLEQTGRNALTDDDYSRIGRVGGGAVSYKSPLSVDELSRMSDSELLLFINKWSDVGRDSEDWLIEYNLIGLSLAFKEVFVIAIVTNERRLDFWMNKRGHIERPIFLQSIVEALTELTQTHTQEMYDLSIGFCDWLIERSNTETKKIREFADLNVEQLQEWDNARRQVVTFAEVCMEGRDIMTDCRAGKMLSVLHLICSQYDYRLDQSHKVFPTINDPAGEAINSTRSRSLQALVRLGIWAYQNSDQSTIVQVKNIISAVVDPDRSAPITIPEIAIIGLEFQNLCFLDMEWAVSVRSSLRTREEYEEWSAFFGSYLKYRQPSKFMYAAVKGDLEYALDNFSALSPEVSQHDDIIDRLGQHVLAHYIWGHFPLRGESSLLDRFYKAADKQRDRWRRLFSHIGQRLRSNSGQLSSEQRTNAFDFFDWRLAVGNTDELQEYSSWLEAECLDLSWRLGAYSVILDLNLGKSRWLYSEVKALRRYLERDPGKVVECFCKITRQLSPESQMYIDRESSRLILRVGTCSDDLHVRRLAEEARDNLLRIGMTEFLSLD